MKFLLVILAFVSYQSAHASCPNLNSDLLYQSIESDNIKLVERLIADPKTEVNTHPCEKRESPLITAIMSGSIKSFNLLISDERIKLNSTGSTPYAYGLTPLMILVVDPNQPERLRAEMIKALLKKPQVNVNARGGSSNPGWTALHYSIFKNHGDEILHELLKRNDLDVNALDNGGYPALFFVSKPSFLKILLDHPSIDTSIKDWNGRTFLGQNCHLKSGLINVLVQHPKIKINEPLENGDTFFDDFFNSRCFEELSQAYYPSVFGHGLTDLAEAMVSSKTIDWNLVEERSGRAIIHSCLWRNITKFCIDLLLAQPFDVNIPDSRGNTPLHLLVEKGILDSFELDYKVTNFLEIKTLKPFIKNAEGKTPFDVADIFGRVLFRYFFGSETRKPYFDPNYADDTGTTALMFIVRDLKHESDSAVFADYSNRSGYARHAADPDYLKRLRETKHFKNVSTLLGRNNLKPIHPVNVNAQDTEGRTALFYAFASSRNIEIVKLLLNQPKIDISLVDKHGQNAFFYAFSKVCTKGWYTGPGTRYLEGLMEVLKDKYNVFELNQEGDSIFHLYLTSQCLKDMPLLEGSSLLNAYGDTPVMKLLTSEDEWLKLKWYVSQPSFNINHQNKMGETLVIKVLKYAEIKDLTNWVADLITFKPDLDLTIQDQDGLTALDYAEKLMAEHPRNSQIQKVTELIKLMMNRKSGMGP